MGVMVQGRGRWWGDGGDGAGEREVVVLLYSYCF